MDHERGRPVATYRRLANETGRPQAGGLGYVGVLAAMIMASLSGSAVADTAAVAALLVPMMRRANYPVNRAAGLIGSGGIIAAIIPPSIPLIIFGVSSGLSISKLFMAGIAPGIMMGVTLMVTGGGRQND